MLMFLFSFLAGLATIISPCVLPVLPIILAGSSTGSYLRPLGVIAGFVSSFTLVTLFLTSLVKFTGVNVNLLRNLSLLIIVAMSLTILVPQLSAFWEKLTGSLQKISLPQKSGFFGGLILGISLGLIWTPCVGPILASALAVTLTGSVTSTSFFIIFPYALGSGMSMLVFMLLGRRLTSNIRNPVFLQKVFAIFMLFVALAIYLGWDKKFQALFPSLSLEKGAQNSASELSLAPDFPPGNQWLNSEPLTLSELKGKVVLIDFWTYTCVNCIRTLPYLEKWQQSYHNQNFTVIGVHTPEFEFEKDTKNVSKAIKDFGLSYPVVQDNDYKIWQSYQNHYWPAHYLIDKQGKIRYTHFGEGNYLETENQIRQLLDEPALTGQDLNLPRKPISPETYLGTSRGDYSAVNISSDFSKNPEFIEALTDSAILNLNWLGGSLHLVLASDTPKSLVVTTDGESKILQIIDSKKYDLYLGSYGEHHTKLVFQNGIKAFAFTFGE